MPQKFSIIGVSGTNGAGKDTVAHFLARHHHYLFVSVSDLLREDLRSRGLDPGRENTRLLSAAWRREFGLSVLVDKAVELYKHTDGDYKGLVVASLRNPYEGKRIHELGGRLIWVDANPEIRYKRVQANRREGRGMDDQKTFEQFLAEEHAEMERSAGADEATLNTAALQEQADIVIMNNGSDVTTLERQVDTTLGL